MVASRSSVSILAVGLGLILAIALPVRPQGTSPRGGASSQERASRRLTPVRPTRADDTTYRPTVKLRRGNSAGSGTIIGSTSYHDIVAPIDRVEIGYTWYAKSWQRTHVNSTCKLLLLTHAFDTLGCKVVGLRTDNFNFASQRAIERLGAKRDGVLRHHALRRDGTVRDTWMYSITAGEWPEVCAQLQYRLTAQRERT